MSKFVKLVVFVPEAYADPVRKVMGDAGTGKIGNYSHCTFSTKGLGRFIPLKGAYPKEGEVNKLTEVVEERIEAVCEEDKLDEVIKTIKEIHPYEEVPIDIYSVELK